MKYFEQYFPDVNFEGTEEVKVLCPFHDDNTPSASINTQSSLFHCYACGVGYNEQQFIAKVNGISLSDAGRVLMRLSDNSHTWDISEADLWANESFIKAIEALHISRKTINDCHLGVVREKGKMFLGIPVFYDGALMDVRSYNLLKLAGEPKMKSQEGASVGYVLPYDLWKKTAKDDTTFIMEGEKDMLLARELVLNAITLTGGAGASPNEFVISAFDGRDVTICYDNDEAGRNGAYNLWTKLRGIAKTVKYINIAEVVKEEKEDFWDYIDKYNGDVFSFLALEEHDFEEREDLKPIFTPIKSALEGDLLRKPLTAQVVVNAEFSDNYAVPNTVEFEKTAMTDIGEMMEGDTRTWFFEETKSHQLLPLIEVDAKSKNVQAVLKSYAKLTLEKAISVKVLDYRTIYKVKVTDIETGNDKFSLDLYTFSPLFVGKRYEIDYRVYPHPTKHQKLVAIATQTREIDNMDGFKPNIKLLKMFQSNEPLGTQLKMQHESMKHHIAKHLNYDMWLMSDLVFNSVLEFDYGDKIRGALDVFVLGDTQVGKSETTGKLVDLYQFGHFLSLKTSSTVGLIGGSNKVDGSWLNTIGAIPRQHRGLIVMEEFSGASPDFITKMTDIRSSGRMRLARAAGELNVPCRARMMTLSNPINDPQGNPRALSTFPNGVIPIMELVKSAEDVARYDAFMLVAKPKKRENPFGQVLKGTPIPEEAYQNRVRWAATRVPEDVVFEGDTASYIWEVANVLNEKYESNFPLFGTTTAQKLARFAVAMACLVVSTDATYQKVVVTRAIVDEVVTFLDKIYDNEIFRLKDYKREFDEYSTLSPSDLENLQKLYPKNATMLEFLSSQASTSRSNLRAISGADSDVFSQIFNKLVRHKFVRLQGETCFPTEKFRQGMTKINKEIVIDTGERPTSNQSLESIITNGRKGA